MRTFLRATSSLLTVFRVVTSSWMMPTTRILGSKRKSVGADDFRSVYFALYHCERHDDCTASPGTPDFSRKATRSLAALRTCVRKLRFSASSLTHSSFVRVVQQTKSMHGFLFSRRRSLAMAVGGSVTTEASVPRTSACDDRSAVSLRKHQARRN
jgi:hypothetical protein